MEQVQSQHTDTPSRSGCLPELALPRRCYAHVSSGRGDAIRVFEPGVADAAAEGYAKWFVARLRLLNLALADGRDYLCGGRMTIADICIGYALYNASEHGLCGRGLRRSARSRCRRSTSSDARLSRSLAIASHLARSAGRAGRAGRFLATNIRYSVRPAPQFRADRSCVLKCLYLIFCVYRGAWTGKGVMGFVDMLCVSTLGMRRSHRPSRPYATRALPLPAYQYRAQRGLPAQIT